MGDIPEIKTKIWVNRSRKIQIAQFEPVELTSGVQSGFETMITAKEISDWMHEMESVVTASLDRQETIERNRILGVVEKFMPKSNIVKPSKMEEHEKWIPSKNPDVFYRILNSGGFVFKNVRTGESWEGKHA